MRRAPSPSKVALVTGGTSGIGRSVAQMLMRDSWYVAVCGRRRDRLQELRDCGFAAFECDVTDPGDVADLIAGLEKEVGRLDALINNAGITAQGATFAETPPDVVRRLFESNVLGTLDITRAALPLLARQGGTIVNLSSTLVRRPRPGSVVYSATKGAIEAFTAALAAEVAKDGIRVHAVAPALIRSEIYLALGMSDADYEDLLATRGREFPMGRVGEPQDVAELIAYLVSDRAAWMTATCIPVDGGAMVGLR